jgi:hypothetical protein
MREILVAELSKKLGVPIDVTDLEPLQYDPETSLLPALPTRVLALQRKYPGVECHVLRLPSVASILAGEAVPPAHTLIAVLSRSEEIRQGARAMLTAAGMPPESLAQHDGEWQGFSTHFARYLDDGLSIMILSNLADAPVAELSLAIALALTPSRGCT